MEASIINKEDIISVEVIPMEDTYDLTIEDNSNFYIATQCDPILVHNSGKSVFIRWYIIELIRHNFELDLKFAWFSPENRPVAREYAKMAEVFTGMSIQEGYPNSMSAEIRTKALRWLEKHIFIISPDRNNFETWNGKVEQHRVNTMESILQYLIYLKKTENIFGFIIDAWNKIEHDQPKYETETNFISKQLDFLINFCDIYDVCGIIIVHPTKMKRNGANYEVPALYDCKGSSAWNEKADIGVIVHRNKFKKKKSHEIKDEDDEEDTYEVNKEAPTMVKIEKLRFEEIGEIGRVKLKLNWKNGGRFEVLDGVKEKPKAEPKKEVKAILSYYDKDKDDELPELPF